MAVISQELTEYTGDIPNKGTMTPEEFDLAAEAWSDHQLALGADINTWAQEVNAVAASANDLYDTAADVNFKGKWANLTGAIYRPAVVWHNYRYWMLIPAFLADVTLYEPAQGSGVWYPVNLRNELVYLTGTELIGLRTASVAECLRGVTFFNNSGSTGANRVAIPSPQSGMQVSFYRGSADYMIYFHTPTRIRWGPLSVGAGYYGVIYMQTKGTFVTVKAFNADEWVITTLLGGAIQAETSLFPPE